jgi:hypothetical protein
MNECSALNLHLFFILISKFEPLQSSQSLQKTF